jgi:hypothetical protein
MTRRWRAVRPPAASAEDVVIDGLDVAALEALLRGLS